MAPHVLSLHTPAEGFHQGFLMGNGWMGQVVYHQPVCETIRLSHIAYYSGEPPRYHGSSGERLAFRAAREATVRGDFDEADAHLQRFVGRKENYGTSLPVGELTIEQPSLRAWWDYHRELNLDTGMTACSFRHDHGEQKRTAFCSHTDRCFCLRITDTAPDGLSACVSLSGSHLSAVGRNSCSLSFEAHAFEAKHSDQQTGVGLFGIIKASLADGEVAAVDGKLMVTHTHDLLLCVSYDTDFGLDDAQWRASTRELDRRVAEISLDDWDELRLRHQTDFSSMMQRQELSIVQRGIRHKGDTDSDDAPSFAQKAQLMYAYGRYLTLCAAREDSPLPISLQGVWNDGVACSIGWTCDMHLDINTQMNYWLCETAALPECHMPLFDWMETRLIPEGRRIAEGFYGYPGWCAELVSNAWGFASPYWHPSLAPCPACGIWQADDYMEHFRYTRDEAFLRQRAYPVLCGAVDFFLSYLFENGKGQLIGGPSISPENAFDIGGKKHYAACGVTFENCLIRALLESYLEARAVLKLSEDDRERQARTALDRLPPIGITEDGTVEEWCDGLRPRDPQHRHMSHLIGLFPLRQITRDTPALASAAENTIRNRLTPYDNWEDTGWSRSMLALYEARLGHGEQAYFHLREMMNSLTCENLLVLHPPTRGAQSYAPVWEMDGNTGFAMAVAEMLLQSGEGFIRLLPALPGAWQDGSLRGFRVREGVTINMDWQGGKPVCVEMKAIRACDVRIIFADRSRSVHLAPDQWTRIEAL